MSWPGRCYAMSIWAAREVQRQAGRNILLFVCLFSLVFIVGTAVLFSQAIDATWSCLIETAPDLVVRRIDAGGWAPMPADAAVRFASGVPGVIDPTPRLWGVASGPGGPVTVVASTDVIPGKMIGQYTPPRSGQAIVGQQVARAVDNDRLPLQSVNSLQLSVTDTFPASTRLMTNDVVWISPDDARQLLGLGPDQASDLAVHLFRREEEKAIQADLAAAFPWPVSITDRSTSALRHHTLATRTGGIAMVACIPALLALLLIIINTGVGSRGQRSQWGLLQSMGWTTGDLVHLQVTKALIVATPALVCGMGAACAAVFYGPAAEITALWITGGRQLPPLMAHMGDVMITLLEIAAMIGLPHLAAVFLACVRSVSKAPWALLQDDPWN